MDPQRRFWQVDNTVGKVLENADSHFYFLQVRGKIAILKTIPTGRDENFQHLLR